ncbi:hypothetical protein L345_15095, partial [Ophiophagus hannah]
MEGRRERREGGREKGRRGRGDGWMDGWKEGRRVEGRKEGPQTFKSRETNSRPLGQMCHVLATSSPVLAKWEKVVIHHVTTCLREFATPDLEWGKEYQLSPWALGLLHKALVDHFSKDPCKLFLLLEEMSIWVQFQVRRKTLETWRLFGKMV